MTFGPWSNFYRENPIERRAQMRCLAVLVRFHDQDGRRAGRLVKSMRDAEGFDTDSDEMQIALDHFQDMPIGVQKDVISWFGAVVYGPKSYGATQRGFRRRRRRRKA